MFQSGREARELKVKVIKATSLDNKDSGIFGDLSDPYVKACVSPDPVIPERPEERQTSVKDNDLNPVWNETLNLPVQPDDAYLLIRVFNSNKGGVHMMKKDQELGFLCIPFTQIPPGRRAVRKDKLENSSSGEIELELSWSNRSSDFDGGDYVGERGPPRKQTSFSSRSRSFLGQPQGSSFEEPGPANSSFRRSSREQSFHQSQQLGGYSQQLGGMSQPMQGSSGGGPGPLYIRLYGAKKLKNTDTGMMGDVSDPYCVVTVGKDKKQTRVINDNLNPVWDERFEFPLRGDETSVRCEVFNKNNIFRDDSLGFCVLELDRVPMQETMRLKEELQGGAGAELMFEVSFVPDGEGGPASSTRAQRYRSVRNAPIPSWSSSMAYKGVRSPTQSYKVQPDMRSPHQDPYASQLRWSRTVPLTSSSVHPRGVAYPGSFRGGVSSSWEEVPVYASVSTASSRYSPTSFRDAEPAYLPSYSSPVYASTRLHEDGGMDRYGGSVSLTQSLPPRVSAPAPSIASHRAYPLERDDLHGGQSVYRSSSVEVPPGSWSSGVDQTRRPFSGLQRRLEPFQSKLLGASSARGGGGLGYTSTTHGVPLASRVTSSTARSFQAPPGRLAPSYGSAVSW